MIGDTFGFVLTLFFLIDDLEQYHGEDEMEYKEDKEGDVKSCYF